MDLFFHSFFLPNFSTCSKCIFEQHEGSALITNRSIVLVRNNSSIVVETVPIYFYWKAIQTSSVVQKLILNKLMPFFV